MRHGTVIINVIIVKGQSVHFSCSVISDSLRPHGLQHARIPSITSSQSLLKLMSIKSVMPSNHLILCHPLLLPPSIFPNISVFQRVSSSHQVAKVLEFQLQHQSLQINTQDWSPLGRISWISLQSKGLSRVFSNITVEEHQFFGAQLSLWSNSHIHTWPLEKP